MLKQFTLRDQNLFAELSGDHNPVHSDEILARRTLFGRRIVHGIHIVLWALDHWLGMDTGPIELESLEADFPKAIGIGDELELLSTSENGTTVSFRLVEGNSVVANVTLRFTESKNHAKIFPPNMYPPKKDCCVLAPSDAVSAKGDLALYLESDSLDTLFPNAARRLPPSQIAALLATTRLVGMECPGWHSIYSGLELAFSPVEKGAHRLSYYVQSYDPRFSLLRMKVEAHGIAGTIKAFFRPVPGEQIGFEEACRVVEPSEFAEQDALVVGGSRGLGEVTAKLLAAGGSTVVLTYFRGAEDAQRVVAEINQGGGSASCLELNVLSIPQDLPAQLGTRRMPSHFYYFATPSILSTVGGSFSVELFKSFCDYYVVGFMSVIDALDRLGSGPRNIFFPSTVFIDEMPRGMGEYCAAKAAGEELCRFLEKKRPATKIHTPRLPRLGTDQTASLMSIQNPDTVEVLLPEIRKMT